METQASNSAIYRGGLTEPVFDAQSVFRAVMNALARPGTTYAIDPVATPPAPLSPTVGAIATTLFDHDTRIWLDPQLAKIDDVAGWLTFHTAAPVVSQQIDAQFAIVAEPAVLPSLESFSQGTQEYPDRSTTLILQIDSLTGGPALRLTGPGIKESAVVEPVGLPPHFGEQWAGNRRRFPRGVDVILAAPEGVIGLPRTTRIAGSEEGEACM